MDAWRWKKWPFLRIVICQLVGFSLAQATALRTEVWTVLIFYGLLFLLVFSQLSLSTQLVLSWWRGLHWALLMVFCSALFQQRITEVRSARKVPNGFILIRVEEQQRQNKRNTRFIGELYIDDGKHKARIGFAYLYVNRSVRATPKAGDIIMVSSAPEPILPPSHPGSFDFAAYAARRGIHHQVYCRRDKELVILQSNGPSSPWAPSSIKQKILEALRATVSDSSHLGLAEALLIGHKDQLDDSLLKAYIQTGVVHIIAISGLHLGIIFVMVNGLIGLVLNRRPARYAHVLLTLPLIWTFTVLSGSSASVNRSAVMFTLMVFGKLINRKHTTLNALLASASLLLALDPELRFDLGFQLSYTAILSILLFEKKINKMVWVKNPMLRYLWSMVSVTLAAQVLTTPLTVFTFHRFPLLFLFANLVAVPLSSLILIMEILMVLLYALGIKAVPISLVTDRLIAFMNYYVTGMDSIPHHSIEQIRISLGMTLLLCLLVWSVLRFVRHPTKRMVLVLMMVLGTVVLLRLAERSAIQNTRRLIILHRYQQSCVVMQQGHLGILITSASLHKDQPALQRIMQETAIAWSIDRWKLHRIPRSPMFIRPKNKRVLRKAQRPSGNWLLIIGHPSPSLKQILSLAPKTEMIVADGTHAVWKIQQWEKETQQLPLRFHSTAAKGPFSISLNQAFFQLH